MKDKLEKFISENRAEFDNEQPSEKVWTSVSKRLVSKTISSQWVWKAAAVFFFCTSVYLLTQHNFKGGIIGQKKQISQEFNDVETFYFDLISEKKSLIYDFEEKNITVDQAFEQDLQKLDAMYQVLKEELKANPSKQVVDALILNLLVRIDILNEQLQELDEGSKEDKGESKQVNV